MTYIFLCLLSVNKIVCHNFSHFMYKQQCCNFKVKLTTFFIIQLNPNQLTLLKDLVETA